MSESLARHEVGDLVASLSTESKAITFLCMDPEAIEDNSSLKRKLRLTQKRPAAWLVGNLIGYCSYSFEPIGLVAGEVIDPTLKVVGYRRTTRGNMLGVPLAGLLLDFSLNNPHSLYQWFGSSSSPRGNENQGSKKRSAHVRLNIFKGVASVDKPLSLSELAQITDIDIHSNPNVHLSELTRNGILNYIARPVNKGYIYYKLSETHPSTEPITATTDHSLMKNIWQITVKSSGENSIDDYIQLLLNNGIGSDLSPSNFRSRASVLLGELFKNGYIDRVKYSREAQSEITLTNTQRENLTRLTKILDRFQQLDPETIMFGRQRAMQILSSKVLVSELMQKARDNSFAFHRVSPDETKQYMIQLIRQNPLTTSEALRDLLAEVREKPLSIYRLRGLLQELEAAGAIQSINKGLVKYWSVIA